PSGKLHVVDIEPRRKRILSLFRKLDSRRLDPIFHQRLACPHVPNPHKKVAAKGREGLSSFHEGYGLPRPRAVTGQPVDFLAAGHVPQADGIVKAPRSEELPVRREDEPLNEK